MISRMKLRLNGEMNDAEKLVKEPGTASKVSPAELASNGDGNKKSQVVHENSVGQIDPEMKQKRVDQRTIPVKHIEVPEENKTSHAEKRQLLLNIQTAMVQAKLLELASRVHLHPHRRYRSSLLCLRQNA